MTQQNLAPAVDKILWGRWSNSSINNMLWILSGTAADFFTDDDVTKTCQAVDKEIRGGSHTYTFVCSSVKLPAKHFLGKMQHLPLCWLHPSKSGICAQPLYWVFFSHLLPVPVKTEHFPSLARQWFAVEISLCQRQTKKEKEILEKWNVTPLVSERTAQHMGWRTCGRCGS